MQILRPLLRPNESETLGLDPSNEFYKYSGGLQYTLKFENNVKLILRNYNATKDFYSNYFPGLKGVFIHPVVSFLYFLQY